MEIKNCTPFSPLLFENQDVGGNDFHVFVLKGSFCILPGERLRPIQEQAPLVMADEYYGDPLKSSVRVESDVIPMKQNAELTLEANAIALDGKPTRSWLAKVSIGNAHKSLRVTGPRKWQHTLLRGWHISEPEPVVEVPIRYEYAFGGTFRHKDEEITCEANPAGIGFCEPRFLDINSTYDAPQIESSDDVIRSIKEIYEPEGFGPIAKHWLPRRELCGTADEAWKENRWPMLPEDFDADYFNGAPYDLIHPGFFNGDEEVNLRGMDASGDIMFRLPEYKIDLFVADIDDYRIHVAMNLDTVHIDVPQRLAYLVWRGTFLKQEALAHVETRMSGPGVVAHA